MPVILKADGLVKYFPLKSGIFRRDKSFVHAVDGVSLHIQEGETLALVGESGCGKSTIGKLLLRLIEPTAGTMQFLGRDILNLSKDELKKFRCEIQIIFQDPYSSLNPRKTIRTILSQPLLWNNIVPKDETEDKVTALLEKVGLSPVEIFMDRYPHQLSGGQKQRIAIARALSVDPKFIVADEPVSYLDVSLRANILNLLGQLKKERGLTYLFITHDLAVVRSISDRVAVMYLGKIVELSPTEDLFNNPRHPYTEALFSSTLIPDPEKTRERRRLILKGEVPSPINPPSGCRFHTRCPYKFDKCVKEEPELAKYEKEHFVACHKS
jgi:oligopeptide/dipeptide ABC transporter ATP-binding protein